MNDAPDGRPDRHRVFFALWPDDATRAAISRAVPPIPVGPFDLVLDAVGVWPESKILWLGPTALPPALGELETQLWDALVWRGFRRGGRDYLPHVTLA